MMKASRKRLMFCTSVIALAAGGFVAMVPAGSKPTNNAYRPPIEVAAVPPAPTINPRDSAVVPVSAPAAAKMTPAVLRNADTVDPASVPSGRSFEGGDKIKILVYEKLPDAELNKFGKNGFSEQNYQLRSEMSLEFTVASDETISIPMLGQFKVTDSTPKQLEAAIATAYQKQMQREGFANIVEVKRPPVLIVGPVKTQGKIDYIPNMTVMHAISLAGGIKNLGGDLDESYTQIEKTRERNTRKTALRDLSDLYAQKAVLEAERDQVAPQMPDALVTLIGRTEANAMIAAEQERRHAIVRARQQQLSGIDQQLQAARQQVTTLQSTNFAALDQAIQLSEARLRDYTRLHAMGQVNNAFLQGIQSEAINNRVKRDEIAGKITEAKTAIGRLDAEKAQWEKSNRSELTSALQGLRQQITANQEKDATTASILRSLNGGPALNIAYSSDDGQSPHWAYRIVRTTAHGPVEFQAKDLTVLEPGDLVKIVLDLGTSPGSDSNTPSHHSPIPTKAAPVNDESPAPAPVFAPERRSDRQPVPQTAPAVPLPRPKPTNPQTGAIEQQFERFLASMESKGQHGKGEHRGGALQPYGADIPSELQQKFEQFLSVNSQSRDVAVEQSFEKFLALQPDLMRVKMAEYQ